MIPGQRGCEKPAVTADDSDGPLTAVGSIWAPATPTRSCDLPPSVRTAAQLLWPEPHSGHNRTCMSLSDDITAHRSRLGERQGLLRGPARRKNHGSFLNRWKQSCSRTATGNRAGPRPLGILGGMPNATFPLPDKTMAAPHSLKKTNRRTEGRRKCGRELDGLERHSSAPLFFSALPV